MKASDGRVGHRVFVVRLEHGDVIPSCIERDRVRGDQARGILKKNIG